MEDTEVQEEVQEDVQEEEETAAEDAATEDVADGDDAGDDDESRDAKTWYPYITKAQFEKFLSRLQSKVPDEVDRDYIRAIIRTPSMIYRFLRGIEAMKLIDRDQRPTDRLGNLVTSRRGRRRSPRSSRTSILSSSPSTEPAAAWWTARSSPSSGAKPGWATTRPTR